MRRPNLRKKYLKRRTKEDPQSHAKQKHLCASLFKKTKTSYYSTLNETNVIGKQKFRKTVTPMLSNKLFNNEKIILVKNEKIITDDKEIAKDLHEFFSNVINFLNKS